MGRTAPGRNNAIDAMPSEHDMFEPGTPIWRVFISSRGLGVLLVVVVLSGVEACDSRGDGGTLCDPGDVQVCPCPGAGNGVQACNSGGTGWNSCEGCTAGQCVPKCSGKECGADPVCGELCGTCGGSETCQSGQCMGSSSEDTYTPPGGTWTDPTSGLTWQVTPRGERVDWSDAKAHCAGLSPDGGGWHLPTISELRSLIRGCPDTMTGGACRLTDDCLSSSCFSGSDCWSCARQRGPADGCFWDAKLQGSCSGGGFWSSSPYEGEPEHAWCVDFDFGGVSGYSVSGPNRVRCVRPGP